MRGRYPRGIKSLGQKWEPNLHARLPALSERKATTRSCATATESALKHVGSEKILEWQERAGGGRESLPNPMNIAAIPGLSGGGGGDGGGHGAAVHHLDGPRSAQFLAPPLAAPNKRKRRPAGTPDPDAEVVALSPKTLMESDRYVCEICNQGFQRDQNLQMHRRRHKVPWKLLKRPTLATTKRVYICPERACLHHDPAHALGDLVGIKKHYRRKHCTEKQWQCDRCSKGYAVQSDYKAHLKTCGTRGHCCDCGRVFSRVESFIEHQDTCSAVKCKNLQSGGDSERSTPRRRLATDRANSTGSPSESSDTTQAMSFTQSRMSYTAARSADAADATELLLDEHARRIQADSPLAATSSAATMPAWLHTDSRHQELELLHRRFPSMPVTDQQLPQSGDQFDVRPLPRAHGSRSQAGTRCSSNSAAHTASEMISGPTILEPSLQLSIGPTSPLAASSASPSSHTNIKPSLSNSTVQAEKEAWALSTYHDFKQESVGFDALGRLAPATVGQCGANNVNSAREERSLDHAMNSFTGFLTALSPVESSAGLHQPTKSKHESNVQPIRASEMASTYHENWTGNLHEPDPAPIQRGFTGSEPASSSRISNKEVSEHLDVADTERHFFGVKLESAALESSGFISCAQISDQTGAPWTSHTVRDEAMRRECNEAQRELARAEVLKREAREQLQFAAAEKAYADRAREVAKRQVEFSEAELAKAKRLRAHAQAELETANSHLAQAAALTPPLCHSCKSVIQDRPTTISSSQRHFTSTSPNPSWPIMSTPQKPEAPASTHSFFINPATGISWTSESMTRDQLWPGNHASRKIEAFPSGLGVEASAPTSGPRTSNLRVAGHHVSSPDDRRDHQIAADDFDIS